MSEKRETYTVILKDIDGKWDILAELDQGITPKTVYDNIIIRWGKRIFKVLSVLKGLNNQHDIATVRELKS